MAMGVVSSESFFMIVSIGQILLPKVAFQQRKTKPELKRPDWHLNSCQGALRLNNAKVWLWYIRYAYSEIAVSRWDH